jgi:hypothetical protein
MNTLVTFAVLMALSCIDDAVMAWLCPRVGRARLRRNDAGTLPGERAPRGSAFYLLSLEETPPSKTTLRHTLQRKTANQSRIFAVKLNVFDCCPLGLMTRRV